ncbi:TonB-dependent receptor plug domain-containing protein [Synoicihabitans lomoniglobus]|uniref:TonB-dependent receptor n=1 Tax=Synoicihabitans lomoniglobus TaxID=2909285 RepID=A0AAF0I696_9BACT|nr:TonB-dependent receptor [Opitutaceae bacterium LMO-M01]WED65971.1 TonB-dependent receptor [Opitutaceae bacterium LMO-M01]
MNKSHPDPFRRSSVHRLLIAGFALAGACTISAQSTTRSGDENETSDTVVLSPFEVTASAENGYLATETLAGTRIRTELRDVGSAISVITKEFMKDIGATDNSTLLQYTTNAEVAGTRGTYAGLGNGTSVDETGTLRAPGGAQRVRGLASADNTRDYFTTDIPWDGYNVDRIDIQRGPNSILFGLGSPAGIVNASLNGASFRNGGNIEFRVGSYGSQRASVDVNQVLIKDVLAIRLDSLYHRERYQQDPAFQDDKRIYGAIRFDPQLFKDPSFRTSLKIKYEHGDIDANRPRNVPPQDSITPWFRPVNLDPDSMDGGLGKLTIQDGYTLGSSASTFNPWLGGLVNQQQPLWIIDGTSNQLHRIWGHVVNTGALNANGVPQGASNGLMGLRYADAYSAISSFSSYANNANLTNARYGQYRNITLTDPTVFNFYENLIDGPTKKEWEGWDAYNIDLSQTAFDDRLGVQLTYDRQKYNRGGEALLGNPTLNIDILQNFSDYVVGPNNANNGNVANSNFGRPFVAGGPGRGNSYESDREYIRASLFGELRATDFFDNGFLTKLLGKHRFNGVYSGEEYQTENRSWQMYANSAAYASYKLQGNPDGLTNLPPSAIIYLGSSLANATSAANANISPILSDVTLQDGNIYQFDMTWRNPTGVNPSDPWNVPANLQRIFNGSPAVNPTTGAVYPQLTQASNPANYVGWNSTFHNTLLRYDDGADQSLVTAASQSMRQTESYAGSWQGFMWNDAIVPTLGWRYDEVQSKSVSAFPQSGSAARGALNLNPDTYRLPDEFPQTQTFKDHSTAGGVVVHVNKLLGDRDPLPLNVSLSYNKSNNFQVTDLRRDIYGNPIANPTGETEDFGVLLGTKDGKYSFRAIKYETQLSGANTQLNNSGIYGTIRDALNWRNIKVYYMSAYAWSTAGQTNLTPYTGQRYLWDPSWVDNTSGRPVAAGASATGPAGSHLETTAEANARRDASIQALNDMQVFLAGTGFFEAWNYGAGPTTQSALQTRGQYETNPIQPDPNSVFDYRTAPLMQGFAVTADTASKGYEFELTANPLPNWRIAFNASQTEAVRVNVGGPVLDELVAYMDTLMAGPGGDLVRFNSDWSAPNELRSSWNSWRGQYTLMKLQENTAASELRKWRYNVVTNYMFDEGVLKNVNVGASYRWQDKVVIGYPVIAGAGGLGSFDLSKPYYGPSEDALDLWVGYTRQLTEKIDWRIQLNMRNVGKGDSLIPISVQPDGQTWASARIAPSQEWFLSNTFSF